MRAAGNSRKEMRKIFKQARLLNCSDDNKNSHEEENSFPVKFLYKRLCFFFCCFLAFVIPDNTYNSQCKNKQTAQIRETNMDERNYGKTKNHHQKKDERHPRNNGLFINVYFIFALPGKIQIKEYAARHHPGLDNEEYGKSAAMHKEIIESILRVTCKNH